MFIAEPGSFTIVCGVIKEVADGFVTPSLGKEQMNFSKINSCLVLSLQNKVVNLVITDDIRQSQLFASIHVCYSM